LKKDIIFKEIIKEIAKDISIYLLNLKIEEDIELIDKELTRIEKREADIIFKHKKEIIHIEIQNQNDKTMHLRMLRYLSDIAFLYPDYEIKQYLIYIGKNKLNMLDNYQNNGIKFRYNIINMHTIDCEIFLNSNKPEAVVLAILCDFKDKDKQEVVNNILLKLIELSENDNLFKKNFEMLNVLSTNRDLKNEIDKGLKMLREVKLEETPLYQYGERKGEIKGRLEGMQEGKKQALRMAILAMMKMNIEPEDIVKNLNLSQEEFNNLIKGEL